MTPIIDTHSHIYSTVFAHDIESVIDSAQAAGVERIMMPAVDSQSHQAMFDTARRFSGYALPMMGLHPTAVNDNPNYDKELELVEHYLRNPSLAGVERFYGVGEAGLDLHWTSDFLAEQLKAFHFQVELALEFDLPLIIHSRDAWAEMLAALEVYRGRGLRGIMHAFSGTWNEYSAVRRCGEFLFGVSGVVTYKNSKLGDRLTKIPIEHLVLETDAPYLTPEPFRGKRNESAYLPYICERVAQAKGLTPAEVACATTNNAMAMFF